MHVNLTHHSPGQSSITTGLGNSFEQPMLHVPLLPRHRTLGMTVAIPVEHIERAYAICALAAWRRKDYEMTYKYTRSPEVRTLLHDEDGAVDLLHYVYSREAASEAAKAMDDMLNEGR